MQKSERILGTRAKTPGKTDVRRAASLERIAVAAVVAGIAAATLFSSCACGGSSPQPYPRQKPDSILTPADTEPRFAYSVEGSLDGRGGNRVTITSAGKVTRTSPDEPLPDTWRISDSQVAGLTALFNRLDFLRMRTTPELYPGCPDAYVCTITFRFRDRMNSVAADQGGDHGHPFWKCLGALGAVVAERRRAVGTESLAGQSARVDSVMIDGKPVAKSGRIQVQGGRPHRISWHGVPGTGRSVSGFSVAVRQGRAGDVCAFARQLPSGEYNYTFPTSPFPYDVSLVVHFSDRTYAWTKMSVHCWGSAGAPQSPDTGAVPPRPRPRMVPSKCNRVGSITVDGRPVAPGETVSVEGGRSHRISWQGICADGCKPMRLSIAVRAGYNGRFIDLANSCPDGNYDYTFPVSKTLFWLTPRVDFTDYTYAWEGFHVIAGEHP